MPHAALDQTPLADRWPQVRPERLVAELVPPPRFDAERFGTYHPAPDQPSQRAAVETLERYAGKLASQPTGRRRWFRRKDEPAQGVYLDGGFGVGKTHLLASLWHAAPEPKVFGTFVELTNLVGALGFARTVEALRDHQLVAIDEFELDDPGDTVLMSTLLTRLSEAGVSLAATSNTLPGALGEGRFAAEDFLREIQALSSRFEVLTIDGEDYRHRGLPEAPPPLADEDLAQRVAGAGGVLDDFPALLDHLAKVHPSRYGVLLEAVDAVGWRGVQPVSDQNVALRLVVLADRLYDRDVPVFSSGVPLSELFTPELLRGGYRKKYHRAISRLTALAREACAA
ncbi:MAG TPA: cell division protein ZapE [Segeticoccus sp.]|uniref:cell division protein ZapE n=1 Tax=Segeticoccus sp. TaxID=2706531 RepID=UPI002D800F9D|nr:cell division protein ZapE [Segeticoccus sp.]HET8600537.1 cell division protein ZapE [Segeticoccus sp.]